jgi:hypothetical protein
VTTDPPDDKAGDDDETTRRDEMITKTLATDLATAETAPECSNCQKRQFFTFVFLLRFTARVFVFVFCICNFTFLRGLSF